MEKDVSRPRVIITVNTPALTEQDLYGRRFIQSLCDFPLLTPEFLGISERYKDPFINAHDYVQNWWAIPAQIHSDNKNAGKFFWGSHWKRRSSLVCRGHVNHGIVDINYVRHDSRIWFESRWGHEVDFSSLFDIWVEIFAPGNAMLHLLAGPELPDARGDHRDFQLGLFGGRDGLGIPNMGWAMAYGRGQAQHVDAPRIRAAGYQVDERDGIFVVRVTEKLSDVIEDFPRFSQRRAKLKTLFPPDMFMIKDEPTEFQPVGRA